MKFVIAILPDPVHTHLSVLFDQFAVAIQEGAQDEKYDFDGSWLPWDDDDDAITRCSPTRRLPIWEKELKENQPGIILFRKTLDCPEIAGKHQSGCKEIGQRQQRKTKTHYQNVIARGWSFSWLGRKPLTEFTKNSSGTLSRGSRLYEPTTNARGKRWAILGPTFSGSLPSLTQLLSERKIRADLDFGQTEGGQRLAIFSGSVSSNHSAQVFQNTFESQAVFHSFVQNDDEILRRFCNYITSEQNGFDPGRFAVISEDETAYGGSGVQNDKDDKNACPDQALKLYYPRDISALRGAYQTKSIFDVGTSAQPPETQKRNLPTDLADPAGKVHDSIRSYGGNQTPLTQEAFF